MAMIYNQVMKHLPVTGGDYETQRKRNDRTPSNPPRGVTVREITLGEHHAEQIEKAGNNGFVFYIHGGGFTTGSAKERRDLCQYIAAKYGYDCISINYRLAPENRWPAQLEDCISAWKAYLSQGFSPEKTVFMGESAGGTLVLSLGLWLRDHGLPLPKAIVSFSPGTNNAEHYPSHFENAKTDYMLRDMIAKGIGEPVFGKDASPELLYSPYVSPVYGDYRGIPPVFLAVSDTEALYDDAGELFQKLQKSGHPSEIDVRHGVCHAYPMFPMIPEARKTIEKVFRFVGKEVDRAEH
ncbi:MAG: alpha/beta hydrolase [Lachnospiraceae bacterium]|nr:alpha/beta hydrolase [Lachnospiraceae bacterium]